MKRSGKLPDPKKSQSRSVVVPLPDKNANKYFSYREAWGRIKRAQAYGYHLEAITLEESIIADRLISFLASAGKIEGNSKIERHSLAHLIQRWFELVPEPIPSKYFPDLRVAADGWRQRRNKVVHGMVKSAPGASHDDVLNFLEEAASVAVQGDALARAITDWGTRFKKQQGKQTSL